MIARLDRPLLLVTGALILYGLLILYSAGQTDVPTPASNVWKRQLVWLFIGVTLAAMAMRISPRILEWVAPALYVGGLIILLITLAIGTGAGTAAGTRSWLTIAGIRVGQPAELAKLTTVLMLARTLAGRRAPANTMRELLLPVIVAALPAGLVMLQPDLGSALVFAGILFTMLYWSGVRARLLIMLASPIAAMILAFSRPTWAIWMVLLIVLLLIWRPFVWEGLAVLGANLMAGLWATTLWNKLETYQQHRLISFLNPEIDPRATGWHIIQSKIAIGSGGWLGKGFTEGSQKSLGFLPAQHTDFILSVVGEELGFIGIVVALGLFIGLLGVLIRIARNCSDPFGSLVAFGVMGILLTHIFENVGMTANVMPITGIPLPFFSYGGSFLLTCLIGIGLCLRLALESKDRGYSP